jgi:DNA-binding CsgD family transcriptional regulator
LSNVEIVDLAAHKSAEACGGRSRPYGAGWTSLTQAELRVVRFVVAGRTNREIAGLLQLSWHTVNSHVRHALQKLDLHSRVDLTRIAMQHDPGIAGDADSLSSRQLNLVR